MTSVKYFHSAMTDAPVLNGTAGSLIGVLDACLVNGFSLRTVDSLTVTSNVATANISAGHGYEVDTIVLIAGATPSGLNGRKRVLSATTNTITFAAPGVADGSATGTMNVRLAPAGWEKPFSGTNLAAYRSAEIASTRCFLRVDDTAAQNARAVGYESMSDINTGTGPFPTSAQVSGGLWWGKANSTATTARSWMVVADDKTFWYYVNTVGSSSPVDGVVYGFGDVNSLKSGDAYGCVLFGPSTDLSASTSVQIQHAFYAQMTSTTTSGYLARAYTAIGGAAPTYKRAESYCRQEVTSGLSTDIPYPNGADNGLILSRMTVQEAGGHVRGVLPGLYFVPQILTATSFSAQDKIAGQGVLAGRKLLAVKASGGSATNSSTNAATGFFDITGPWS
jgi:hypothetical protein